MQLEQERANLLRSWQIHPLSTIGMDDYRTDKACHSTRICRNPHGGILTSLPAWLLASQPPSPPALPAPSLRPPPPSPPTSPQVLPLASPLASPPASQPPSLPREIASPKHQQHIDLANACKLHCKIPPKLEANRPRRHPSSEDQILHVGMKSMDRLAAQVCRNSTTGIAPLCATATAECLHKASSSQLPQCQH